MLTSELNWVDCVLEDIGIVVTGKTPSTKDIANFGGAIPFVKPGDLNSGGYVTFTADTLTEKGFSLVPRLPKNAIMVTCIGNLGKVGITSMPSATNQQINSVVPHQLINSKYLYFFLLTIKAWLEKESSTTTVSIINKGKFSKAPIKLPPLAEQQQIAAKLDELLAQVDNLKTRLDTIPKILKRFRQSVLAAAVSGKLTENWREKKDAFEPIEMLNWKWIAVPSDWKVLYYSDLVQSRLGKMLDKAKNTG
ncbi:MAG: restriction endonuclease subunit S, partial [Methylococcaceae bacterium]